ncbi:MAG: diacylglycerol kinase family lipid kinase [Bacteroidales bacterium]|nr:diacylglycerol kinase family lipid kinase [Bacteroidales bacterium]
MNQESQIWFIIVNPGAGSGKTISGWPEAERALRDLAVPYKAVFTSHKGHAKELTQTAAEAGYRRFVAVGGDGSIHEVTGGIMSYCDESGTDVSEFSFAVIPIGSGNDWIRTAGIPNDPRKAVELIAAGHFEKSDVVRVETTGGVSYMANVGGTGFDSRVCDRVNHLKERGRRSRFLYARALMRVVLGFRALEAEVICDGKTVFSGSMYSLAIGNGRYSGGGMIQVPGARMDDGTIDVTVVPVIPFSEILRDAPKLKNGRIADSKSLQFFRCKELEVRQLSADAAHSPELVEVDGEIEGALPMRVSVSGGQINVIANYQQHGIQESERG